MDATTFDDLAVILAGGIGRRGALRALLGAALGGGLASAPLGGAAAGCFTTGKRCKHARQCCSGKCVKGECADCGRGTTECGHACVDPRTDPKNCGRCGRRCGATEQCENGRCRDDDPCEGVDCSFLDGVCTVGVCLDGGCVAQAINVGAACAAPEGGTDAAVCQADGRCCVPPGGFAGRPPGGGCLAGNCCGLLRRCDVRTGICG